MPLLRALFWQGLRFAVQIQRSGSACNGFGRGMLVQVVLVAHEVEAAVEVAAAVTRRRQQQAAAAKSPWSPPSLSTMSFTGARRRPTPFSCAPVADQPMCVGRVTELCWPLRARLWLTRRTLLAARLLASSQTDPEGGLPPNSADSSCVLSVMKCAWV